MNHPAVTLALEAFRRPELPAIGALAGAAGLSHRRFITLFQRAVGMAPSEYRRIVRLQRSLDAMAGSLRSLAAVAVEHGFADQAHLTREVRALTGLTPGAYRAARPMERNHVPLTRASDSFKTAPAEAPRIPSNTKP
jgi:AraC-like DNA-binding protein